MAYVGRILPPPSSHSALHLSLCLGHLPPESSLTFLVRSPGPDNQLHKNWIQVARKRCAESPGGGFAHRGHQMQPADMQGSSLQPGTSEKEPSFVCLFLITFLLGRKENKPSSAVSTVWVCARRGSRKACLFPLKGRCRSGNFGPIS